MNHHYACSDLHGKWELWEQINNFCDETDTIYFLGDAIDRGPDGVKLMFALLTDKRIKYIKGNHEDMLVEGFYNNDFYMTLINGGSRTVEDFQLLSELDQPYLIHRLQKLPEELEYINPDGLKIIMNHSGFSPKQIILYKTNTNPYLWDRQQITYPWAGDDNTLIIHGHTPVQYLIKKLNKVSNITNEKEDVTVVKYCGGHKLDIDLGSFATNKAALVDLDTLDIHYFNVRKEG